MMTKEWFASWFDSPFYHILYGQHDEKEAHAFIDKLINYLDPLPGSRFLDVACGKGRHSLYLSGKDYDVTGIDLSANSIAAAKEHNHDHVHFERHDMRFVYRVGYFDYVLNMFTSFGYFDNEKDNLRAITAMHENLKSEGICVLDYFNANFVGKLLTPVVSTSKGNINFHITKRIQGKEIIKNIQFDFDNQHYDFTEKVWLYDKKDFESLFIDAGFNIQAMFGDYSLNPFDEQNSPRLIIIAEKA